MLDTMKTETPFILAAETAAKNARAESLDWQSIALELEERGYATLPSLLSPAECQTFTRWYSNDDAFRSTVIMSRHGFGQGEYRYLRYPLPNRVASLRESLYARLAPIANRWNELLKIEGAFPPNHADYLERCHQAGQTQPTPLILRYVAGDYNCLHQDLYGEQVFPLQVAILLSDPVHDFTGGKFVLTEQRPRMQSRVEVVPLKQGDAVVFAVCHRPRQGTRGVHRVTMRHGVSRIRSGERYTLGIIFHDAK